MIEFILVIGFVLLVLAMLIGAFWTVLAGLDYLRSFRDSGVREIRDSPRRTVEKMTVDEFRELGFDYLREHGYELDTRMAEDSAVVVALREDRERLVRLDPAADLENPRAVNQLQVDVRRLEIDGVIAITTADLPDKSRDLLTRMEAEVLDPQALVAWRRSGKPDVEAASESP